MRHIIAINIFLLFFTFSILGETYTRPKCGDKIDQMIREGELILHSNTDSSRFIFDQALKYAISCKDSLGIAKVVNFIGVCYYLKSDYENASKNYYHALGIAERNNFILDLGIVNNNLGALYFDLQEYKKSEKFYNNALEMMLISKDTNWLSRVYGNIAGVHYMNQKYNLSIDALNKSMELAVYCNNYKSVGGALANLAMVHTSLGNNNMAIEAYDKGVRLLDSTGDYRGACIALIEKGKLQTSLHQFSDAKKTLEKALENALELGHTENVMKSYLALSNNSNANGELNLAFKYYKEYNNWKDSLFSEEKFNTITELNKKYETDKKEKEIAYLTTESKLKDLQVEKRKSERNNLILLALLLFAIITFIFIQLRQKNKLNLQLTLKNKLIEDSLKEREVLIREVHHRVKNNLQVVSSMLNIQANTITDKNTKQAILESRKRVQSMSIVHQKLYKTDQVGKVDTKDYFEHLINEVESFYDFTTESEIQIQKEIQSFELNIDTLIPLGLIVTELISNAYKHAFKEKDSGKIKFMLSKNGNDCFLTIHDNGKGITNDPRDSNSFGIKLISSLSRSLKTELTWENEKGTKVSMTFRV